MISKSEKDTHKLAKDLVAKLKKPKVIALYGDLGAGKTTFVQGLAKELGLKTRILSPTFVFLRSYPLNDRHFKILHHVDLYRAENFEAASNIGIEELFESDALVTVEWPEIIEKLLPADTIRIRFRKISNGEREIEVN